MTDLRGLAVIGGGRWARVHARVVDPLLPPGVPRRVCSPGYPAGWREWCVERPQWTVVTEPQCLFEDPAITHVIIARRARDHADTTLAALAAGKAVLVEKPFCLTAGQASLLLAASRDRPCNTGLVFHLGRNQTLFRDACLARGPLRQVALDWVDPRAEMRDGVQKTFYPGLNVVQDVLPHAWSVLRPLVAEAIRPEGIEVARGGCEVTLALRSGETAMRVRMCRNGPRRIRDLRIGGDGWSGRLDFAVEPGTAELDGHPVDVQSGFESPLTAELRAFLDGSLPPLTRLDAAREAIDLTLWALPAIRTRQAEILGSAAEDGSDEDAAYARREILAGGIAGDGTAMTIRDLRNWLSTSG